jgi:hypothetical protein
MFWALLCLALLCFALLLFFENATNPEHMFWALPRFSSKIARARTTWCGALLSSLRAFLKIISGFIPCSGLFIMPHRTMSKIGDLRAHGVVLFSSSLSTFLEKKTFRVRPMFCALLSSRYEFSKIRDVGISCSVLCSFLLLPLSKTNRVCPHVLCSPPPPSTFHPPKPDMQDSHVLCSPLFLKNVQDYKRMCTPFTRKKESKIDSR